MTSLETENDVLEKVRRLSEYFHKHLSGFQIGSSGSAHYENGQTGDLAGGREFQLYRPSTASPDKKHAAHRVRIARAYLDGTPLETILEQLERWKLIERLNCNGKIALSVSCDGLMNDQL